MEKIKAFVFDLDGTLIDSKKAYYLLFQEVLKQNKINFKKRKLWKELNGQRAEEVFSKILNKKEKKKIKKLCEELREKEVKEGIKIVKPIKNAKETVELLRKKFKVYLITNSDKKFTFLILEKFGFKFNKIFAREDFKDKSKVIRKIANFLGIKTKEIIYVGDAVIDVKVARKAKCKVAIIPNWSPKYLVKKEKPDYLFDSIKQLILNI
jgi:phosphoglycolate phosphatase-like HAD superfamily hydrolase